MTHLIKKQNNRLLLVIWQLDIISGAKYYFLKMKKLKRKEIEKNTQHIH